jgi:hypothetical protein
MGRPITRAAITFKVASDGCTLSERNITPGKAVILKKPTQLTMSATTVRMIEGDVTRSLAAHLATARIDSFASHSILSLN